MHGSCVLVGALSQSPVIVLELFYRTIAKIQVLLLLFKMITYCRNCVTWYTHRDIHIYVYIHSHSDALWGTKQGTLYRVKMYKCIGYIHPGLLKFLGDMVSNKTC